eukprot:Nk52_evm6s224 gene=Nk52_evmTU6s224
MTVEQSSSVLILEHPLVKVPYESLSRAFRSSQKIIEKEIISLVNTIGEMPTGNSDIDPVTMKNNVDGVATRLRTLKRKLEASIQEEERLVQKCKIRLDHLQQYHLKAYCAEGELWKKKRLDRILVDYFLREGYGQTALRLAEDSQIEDLVDIELFEASERIEKALAEYNCGPALLWCSENKTKLRKTKSTLEFNLRVQEFIELVRANRRLDAISYARRYLTGGAETNVKEIQKAMALLAFSPDTECTPYRESFDKGRWNQLISQFREENYVLHSLTSPSVLCITMQAGLSALKTPMCYQEGNKSLNCPVCTPKMGTLSEDLPFSHRIHSCLVCRISNEIMNEDNPPMVLPNGYVYSRNALSEMAKTDGYITCPRTRDTFRFSDALKVYVM